MRTLSLVVISYGLLGVFPATAAAVEGPATSAASDAGGSQAQPRPATDPRAIAQQGLTLMQEADHDSQRMVDAALAFAQACRLFQDAGDVDAVNEMQADLFWCRKRMDVDALSDLGARSKTAGVDASVPGDVPMDQAQAWFDRAKAYADTHQADDLEVAMRWFEVAERFQGTKVSLDAQRLSLEAQEHAQQHRAAPAPSQDTDPAVALGLTTPDAQRLAPPPPATVKAAVADLRKVMKDAYAANGKAGKRALAEALLARADAAGDDNALRYTLLSEAREAAMLASEPCAGLIATKKISDAFDVDGDALTKEMLARCSGEPAAAAYGVLLTRPDDAKALATVGRYEALTLGKWDAALPRLAHGDDAAWAKAAQAELAAQAPATAPGQQAAVANDWYALSRKAGGQNRLALAAHAQIWFHRAIPGLAGTALDIANQHSQELADELPVFPDDYDHLSQRQWDRLDGSVITVTAGGDTFDSGTLIPANVRVQAIPAPADTWTVGRKRVEIPCGAAGITDEPRGQWCLGQLLCGFDKNNELALGPIAGPGHLYFFPVLPLRGTIDGSIRVKLVSLPAAAKP